MNGFLLPSLSHSEHIRFLCYDYVRFMDNVKYGEVVFVAHFSYVLRYHVFDKSSHSETRGLSMFSITVEKQLFSFGSFFEQSDVERRPFAVRQLFTSE